MIKSQLRHAIAAAFAVAAAAPGAAFAIYEVEPNDSAMSAHLLPGNPDGAPVEVTGILGETSRSVAPVADLDFYAFDATAGDVVQIDIDGGWKSDSTTRSLDSYLAVWSEALGIPLRNNDDATTFDPGSLNVVDARIDNFVVPATGRYYIGVTSTNRRFITDSSLTTGTLGSLSNGSYTLIVSGAKVAAPTPPPPPPPPPVHQVNIDIKPHEQEITEINAKWRRHIPVALLSSPTFDATAVDIALLTFGATGTEKSLYHCRVDDGDDDRRGRHGRHHGHHKHTTDVNRDGLVDLVCHFDVQDAGFEVGDIEGVMMGVAADGRKFEGRASLKVVPQKKKHRHHNNRHRHHGDRDD